MQKIIFISIILLTGLFSLQMQLASKTQAFFKAPVGATQTLSITPVNHVEPAQVKIFYIYPESDTLDICTRESAKLIQL